MLGGRQTAVKAVGLVDTLSGPEPFTFFAPMENKSQLRSILTYHVVAGSVYAKDVKAGEVMTVNGAKSRFPSIRVSS